MNCCYTAQAENTISPNRIKGVAEYCPLAVFGSIGSIEYDRGLGFEKAAGKALAAVAFFEFIRDARTNDPVDPSFHDCRGLTPPVGMDDRDAVGLRKFVAMPLNKRIKASMPLDFSKPEARGQTVPHTGPGTGHHVRST